MSKVEFLHESDAKTEREQLIDLFAKLIKKMDEEHLSDTAIYGLNPKSMHCIYDCLLIAEKLEVMEQ